MRGGGNPFSLARKKGFPPPSRSPLPPQNALFSPRQPPDAREYPMSHEQKEHDCTPRLRFPEFSKAGEWKRYEVGDLFAVTRGEVLAMTEVKAKETDEFSYPVYSSQTKNNGLAGFYSKYLYEDAITWTTDGANAGDVKFRKGKFYCTNVCGVLLSNSGYANKCIAEIINSIAKEHVSYVGNPKLMNNVMKKIEILIPPLAEQQKIADCLTSLDDLITAHEQKRDALTQHKKGLMQRLFPAEGETTPRWRFPEFREAGEWEMKKLNDCCRIITGGTPSRKNPSYWNGKIPWISSRHISDIHTVESCEYITEKGIKYSSTKVIPKDSIILVSRVSVGKYAKTVCDTAINQDITALLPYSINCNFLFFYVDIIAKMIKNSAAGTGVVGVSQDFFDNIVINAPTLPEQQKIADCLSSLDERIAAQEAKIAALREHKTGLMQQLFPRAL